MNKLGKANLVLWAILIIAGIFIYMTYISEPSVPDSGDGELPSDLQTTVDLKFKDELATSETNVDSALWYLFNGDGTYFKSGTADSSGEGTVTTRVNRDYTLYAYKAGYGGYINKKVEFNTGSDPRLPVTVLLVKRSGLEVSATDDPIDVDQNITGTMGATEELRVKWKVNVSNAGSLNPIIVVQTNNTATGVEDIKITKSDTAGGKYSKYTCPDRVTSTDINWKLYCFQRDKIAYASEGIIISYLSIKFDDTTQIGDEDHIDVWMIDTALYLKPGYTTIDGILFGAEDDSDTAIGSGDAMNQSSYLND